jgi:hypothetical protein
MIVGSAGLRLAACGEDRDAANGSISLSQLVAQGSRKKAAMNSRS